MPRSGKSKFYKKIKNKKIKIKNKNTDFYFNRDSEGEVHFNGVVPW